MLYAYDQAGRLVSMKSFRAAEQKIEDNPMTRQDGDETLWSYDEATGLLLSKTYPDLHQELYGYDNMNRLTSKTQARQVDDRGTPLTTTYVYDEPSGRLLQVSHNDGTASTQYSYDHLGALTQAGSSALDYQFAYDAQGRLSTQSSQGLGAHQLHYRYDALNRLNSYALNYGGTQVLESQLGYDVWGRLGEVRLNGAAQGFAYHYDAQGGYLKSMSYPHGLQKDITLEAQRDLPVAITYKKASEDSFKWGNEYQFDALGRPINKKDYLNATQANLIHHYTHNDRHELVSDAMSDGRVCAYDYDNIGNRKNAQEGNDFHCTYQTNELNQYVQGTQADGATFVAQYDADGNQTLILSDTGVWQVRYNALNQAVCFIKQADASQAGTEISVRIECEYDHMGRRVAKKVFEGGSIASFKRYLYAGYLQIAELDAMVVAADEQANPVLRKTYLWDPMQAKATRLLAMSRFDASGAKVEDLYYAQDMLKNTIALLDAQGASRALYEYDPYGKVIKMQGDLARENPFRHSCEYADDETGLVYYNYRYYNTQDGRWINRDPIAERGGVNLYAFIYNSPVVNEDRFGLYAVLCFAYAEEKITGFDKSDPNRTIDINNVFSGNGSNTNNPNSQHKTDQGPLPEGEYWIGKKYTPSSHTADAAQGGNYDWHKLYGDDGKGGKSYDSIPVKDPNTEQIINRGAFNLHTGRASNGCITVRSEIDDSNPKYPQSKDYDKLSDFLDKAGKTPFKNPRKPEDTYIGIMLVKKCLKDCKKALENYKR